MLKTSIVTILVLQIASAAPLDCACGIEGGSTRIVNGAEVQKGKYPWMVALLMPHPSGQGLMQFCGGSVINNEWVLTAAHCIPNLKASDITVVRSTENLQSITSDKAMAVDKTWSHPDYVGKDDFFHNDIALLHLSKPITFSKEISPICLPSKDMENFDNLFNIGWGKTSVSGSGSLDLLYIDTNQVDVCYQLYEKFNFWEKQVCTYAVGNGICQGDSGGPLSTRVNGHVTQVGINSWVVAGTCGQFPDVTTRVSEYLDDIDEVTAGSSWCRNPNLGE